MLIAAKGGGVVYAASGSSIYQLRCVPVTEQVWPRARLSWSCRAEGADERAAEGTGVGAEGVLE
jgi:hypothetical protein